MTSIAVKQEDRIKVYRGEVWTMTSRDRGRLYSPASSKFECWSKGALAVNASGEIAGVGDWSEVSRLFPHAEVQDFGDAIIMPGFVDLHLHFPQTNMIGCFGEKLLGWLDRYTFPIESSFVDAQIAKKWAEIFCSEMLKNGTTTSMVFSSSHEQATDLLFQEAKVRGIRAIIGKVSMDRNAPADLLESAERDAEAQRSLIAKWHGHEGRLFCALTPRFAPSCTEELMASLQTLKREYPDLYIQTHFAESKEELAWVKELFPNDRDYLAVYERFDLIGPKTVLAHAIFASPSEAKRIAERQASIAHCPTSNLFLGSGLFPREQYMGSTSVGLGTDVGGGTSFSMWRTMEEAYKIQQLRGQSIDPTCLFFMATLGGAQALGMQDRIGALQPGMQADFQVIDWKRNRLLVERLGGTAISRASSPLERLFALMHLADDRLVSEVFVRGESRARREP